VMWKTPRSRLLAGWIAILVGLLGHANPSMAEDNLIAQLFKRELASPDEASGAARVLLAAHYDNPNNLQSKMRRSRKAVAPARRPFAIGKAIEGKRGYNGAHDPKNSIAKVEELYAAGKYDEARPIAEAVLARADRTQGANLTETCLILNYIGLIAKEQRRFDDAEVAYKRALSIYAKLPAANQLDVATTSYNLGLLYSAYRRWREAERAYSRALEIREQLLDPESADIGIALNDLGQTHQAQGSWRKAEQLFERSLSILEKAQGPTHEDVTHPLNSLGLLYREQGRLAEAEQVFNRYLSIAEKNLGSRDPEVATALNNLAHLYYDQERFKEAEAYFKRALDMRERDYERDPLGVTSALNNLAETYRQQERYVEALPLYERALAIRERVLGEGHPDLTPMLNNLGLIAEEQLRPRDAERFFKRALAIREQELGQLHAKTAEVLLNLGGLMKTEMRFIEAEQFYQRALTIARSSQFESDHPFLGLTLSNWGGLHIAMKNWREAGKALRESVDIVIQRSKRSGDNIGRTLTSDKATDADRESSRFKTLVRVGHRLFENESSRAPELLRDMFMIAQWGLGSSAATAVAQMTARIAHGQGDLGLLVRERQDLIGEWQDVDGQLATAKRRSEGRDEAEEKRLSAQQGRIEARIAQLDDVLRLSFPEYAELANPQPLSISDAQSQLREGEVLALFVNATSWNSLPGEVLMWLVPKSGESRWLRRELGTVDLTQRVRGLRCGLDASSWSGDGEEKCRKLLGAAYTRADVEENKPLPFDLEGAHELYLELFGEAQDLLMNSDGSWKHLIVVPSGPLAQLPFQVLVTEKPKQRFATTAADLADIKWLGTRQAISIVPSVSNLKGLRRVAMSAATKPYIGFGNPILDGSAKMASLRNLAVSWTHCSSPDRDQVCRGAFPLSTSGGQIDQREIRKWSPLPQTACELCAIAQHLKVSLPDDDVHLGNRARKTDIKFLGAILPGAARSALQDYKRICSRLERASRAGSHLYTTSRRGVLWRTRKGRRLSDGVRNRSPQARCGLGDLVGLQHRGWHGPEHRGLLGARPRFLLCGRPRGAGFELGGLHQCSGRRHNAHPAGHGRR
jgi:tetratricopeptide (TPR) repeat protein